MVLAIDIGNTNITFGLFKGRTIIRKFSIRTKDYCFARIRKRLANLKEIDAIICSVVPKTTKRLKRDLQGLLKKQPYIIGKDIRVPIKNLYRPPWQVGQDRLVNVYYGSVLYGAPLVVIDFGTAITFDVVSRRKEYLGGMILPGLNMSLTSLSEKTSLLPKIKLSKPEEFIGRDTKNSILSGIAYGFAGACNYLIKELKNKIGKTARIIGTGGDIQLISHYCSEIDRVDQDLTLKAINLVYCPNFQNPKNPKKNP